MRTRRGVLPAARPRGAACGSPPGRPRTAARRIPLCAPLGLSLAAAVAVPPAAAAQLLEAELRVTAETDSVRVAATYRLAAGGGGTDGGLRLDALRVPGRELRLSSARVTGSDGPAPPGRGRRPAAADAGRDLELERHPGLHRLRGPRPAGAWREWTVRVEYAVSGTGTRVPVFVPSVPAPPAGVPIRIRVEGVPADVSPTDAFPRMRRVADGALLSAPDNVPSLLVLPSGSRLPLTRIADVLVVLVVLGATAGWLRRRSRAAR